MKITKLVFNKGLFVAGLIFAVMAGALIFVVGMTTAPPPVAVMAARTELSQDMPISAFGSQDVVAVNLRTDNDLIGAYVTPEQFESMKMAGGILIDNVMPGEFLRHQDIVSPANYMSQNLTALALQDPNKIVVFVEVDGDAQVSQGIRPGDMVDLALTVDTLPRDNSDMGQFELNSMFQSTDNIGDLGEIITPRGTVIYNGTEYAPNGAEMMSEDGKQEEEDMMAPFTKMIISNAQVVRLVREGYSTYSSSGQESYTAGAIEGLEIIINRDDFEILAMAQTAGTVYISLVSPFADAIGSTEGYGMRDFVDAYLEAHPVNENKIEYYPTLPPPAEDDDELGGDIEPTSTPQDNGNSDGSADDNPFATEPTPTP